MLDENITIPTHTYKEYISRLNNDEPIEYITNKVSFYSNEFFIAQGALIPRPETEILIDITCKLTKDLKSFNLAEIGVGSGIISIMLNRLCKNIHSTTASDISNQALKIASKNISNFELQDKITLVNTNLLDNINQDFDVIVSNPPYIANDYTVENNLSYEPQNALFGGVQGDEILIQIIDLFLSSKAKYLICEMGYDQKEPIKEYLKNNDNIKLSFYKDLSGFDRGFYIEK